MSRALARLREATGDPLLVRAGRGLVASPRALALRDTVGQLVHDAEAALRPADELDLGQLDRTFTLRATEGWLHSESLHMNTENSEHHGAQRRFGMPVAILGGRLALPSRGFVAHLVPLRQSGLTLHHHFTIWSTR